MSVSPGSEFDMPLEFQGRLANDPQFDGMVRRFHVSREAMDLAVGQSRPRLSDREFYAEFFFDIWRTLPNHVWTRKPVDGLVRITSDDIGA